MSPTDRVVMDLTEGLPPGWEAAVSAKSHKIEPTSDAWQLEVRVMVHSPVDGETKVQRVVFVGPAVR